MVSYKKGFGCWWVVAGVGGYILAGDGWRWIFFGWWWVVVDGDGWWWVVVGGGGWWWVVVGRGGWWWVVA